MEFEEFVNEWIPEHSVLCTNGSYGVMLHVDKDGKLVDLTWIDPTSIGGGRYLYRWVQHDCQADPLPDVKNIHECKVGKIDIQVRTKKSIFTTDQEVPP